MSSFFKSFTYAFNGIKLSLQQRNMKVHVCCAFLAIVFGFILKINLTEWCIVLICIGVVLALEIFNTAIESFVDLVEPNYHPVAGKIKDLGAGAGLFFLLSQHSLGL